MKSSSSCLGPPWRIVLWPCTRHVSNFRWRTSWVSPPRPEAQLFFRHRGAGPGRDWRSKGKACWRCPAYNPRMASTKPQWSLQRRCIGSMRFLASSTTAWMRFLASSMTVCGGRSSTHQLSSSRSLSLCRTRRRILTIGTGRPSDLYRAQPLSHGLSCPHHPCRPPWRPGGGGRAGGSRRAGWPRRR